LRLAAKGKPQGGAGLDPIPEFVVVVDGATATFENVGEKVYFSVPLPRNGRVTPIMFMPQMQTVADVVRDADAVLDGKPVMVFRAQRGDGSTSRIELDPATYHIRRLVVEIPLGQTKAIATLTADRETFDGPVSDKEFVWKAPRGAKSIPAPPGTSEMFGTPDAPTAGQAR
jgi:outer membrane lipoprotein-sorting protein